MQSLRIQLQKKIVNIWQIKRVGRRATKFETARLHFFKRRFCSRRRYSCLSSPISEPEVGKREGDIRNNIRTRRSPIQDHFNVLAPLSQFMDLSCMYDKVNVQDEVVFLFIIFKLSIISFLSVLHCFRKLNRNEMKYAMWFWWFRHKIMNKPYVNTIILPEFLRKKIVGQERALYFKEGKVTHIIIHRTQYLCSHWLGASS